LKSLFIIVQHGESALIDLLPTIFEKTRIRLVGIGFLAWRPAGSRRAGNGVRERIHIYGIRTWTVRQVLGLWRRAKSLLRSRRLTALLKAHGIPWFIIDDANGPGFLQRLRQLTPDLVLSIAIPQRFGPDLLGIPRIGCINVHFGPLPEYRGLYTSFWTLYNGERESGVSIHFMNNHWDGGPIIAQRRFPVEPGETVRSLDRKKWRAVPNLLSEALDALVEGRVMLGPNERDRGAYYSVPSREVLLAFRKERRGLWV
jgi:folate-dependent phosphoribosylglycinamide formyltransferase PurN